MQHHELAGGTMAGGCSSSGAAARGVRCSSRAARPFSAATGPSARPPGSTPVACSRLSCSSRRAGAARLVCTAAGAGAGAGDRLALLSPSKVNLFLRVVRRREDGYHDLASLFHVIDLGDDMEFTLLPPGTATSDQLICSDPTIPHDDSNLVIKALNLFRRKTGRSDFFRVKLDKHVPHGAGLGGGSGNAATALYAANELTGHPATNAQLLAWSGDIGSDISVFFSNTGAAYCTGRGEVVEDVAPPLPPSTPLLLLKPPVGLSTPAIFKALNLDARSNAEPRGLLDSLARAGRITPDTCVNDLEQPAFDNLPELPALKARLIGEGLYDAVFMTGSGSTIVAVGGGGSDGAAPPLPGWLSEEQYKDLFVSPARLILRQPGGWYERSSFSSKAAAAAVQAAAAAS